MEKKTKPKTDKEQKEIIAYYAECQNYCETARKFGMSDTGVRKIIKKNADKLSTKMIEEKKSNNTKEVIQDMDDRKETIKRILGKLLTNIENKSDNIDMFTSIRDLAMAYGTIVDKEFKRTELELKKKEIELREKELKSDGALNSTILNALTGKVPEIWDEDDEDVKNNKQD